MPISARFLSALLALTAVLTVVGPSGLARAQARREPTAAAPAGAQLREARGRALVVNAFEWQVASPRIILGDTTGVDVVLTARQPDGTPLDVAPPRLSVSTGSVSPPVRRAPGVWTTTFTPAAVSFPHVAILFATIETAATSAVGFVPLRLWGRGQTTVKTKPHSRVTVFIGNESFGPVDADEDGAARVPIVVPPGPERAVARSVDGVGNESQKTIDLGVPPFNRLAMVPLDDVASADGSGEARLLVFVVDKKGEPLYEASFVSRASVGEVDGAPVGLSPGMFRLGYRPGKAARGEARIDVTLDGAPGSAASARVALLSGRPTRASIETPRAALSADEPRAVTLDVRLFDQAGNAVPATAASVDVDYGRIDEMSAAAGGARRVTWVIPPQLRSGEGGDALEQQATLTVRSPSGDVLGTRSVALLPGKPARLSFDAVEAVVADGQTSVEVRLRASDAAGNVLVPTGASVALASGGGGDELVAGTVDGRHYRIRFIPAARDRQDFAFLDGTMGELKARTRVRLVPRPRPRLLVGPGVTAGSNYGSLLQAGPDLSLLVRLPGLDGAVHAGLSVSMLQALDAPAGVDHRSFPLFLEGAWRPLLTSDVAMHLGAGLGFVLTDELKKVGAEESRLVLPGAAAQAVAGVGYRLGSGFLELDVRAGYALTFPGSDVGAPLGVSGVLAYRFGI